MSTSLPPEMFAHYAQGDESRRLLEGAGELERIRSQDLIGRHLRPPPAIVLDVGGAAGVHALWLASLGYEVHLVDAIARHVEQARQASAAQPSQPLASCRVGDARELAWPDASVDAVLMLGPLYHLTERADRLRALREALRVLRPGGRVFAAAVSRLASLLSGVAHGLLDDPVFAEIVRRDLKDGQHRNPTGNLRYFTTTFLHRPEDLRSELEEAGFSVARLAALEGPVMWAANFDAFWNDRTKRDLILEFLHATEEDPAMVATGAHFLGVGEKSGN